MEWYDFIRIFTISYGSRSAFIVLDEPPNDNYGLDTNELRIRYGLDTDKQLISPEFYQGLVYDCSFVSEY